ncbi:MAG TPA: hypothetical protein VGB00_06380 [Pyrinomonadaceae bacterium]|jgi:hypothetical protein
MPEILSILFAALILVACFKLFFDDLKDLRANFKHFSWWFTFEMIFELSPETNRTGLRVLFWLALGALGGFLLYHNLSK